MRTGTWGGVLATAALVGLATPATAGDWHRWHHQRDRGDAVAGALILGAVVGGVLAAGAAGRRGRGGDVADEGPAEGSYIPAPHFVYDTDDPAKAAAVDACVGAIEEQAQAAAPWSAVTQVTTVVQVGQRFTVHGRVVLAGGPGDRGERHVFRCRLVPGLIQRATIDEAI